MLAARINVLRRCARSSTQMEVLRMTTRLGAAQIPGLRPSIIGASYVSDSPSQPLDLAIRSGTNLLSSAMCTLNRRLSLWLLLTHRLGGFLKNDTEETLPQRAAGGTQRFPALLSHLDASSPDFSTFSSASMAMASNFRMGASTSKAQFATGPIRRGERQAYLHSRDPLRSMTFRGLHTSPRALDDSNKSRTGLDRFAVAASSFAAALCALHCSVLPAVLAALPLLDWTAPDHAMAVHTSLRAVALYFLVPVGTYGLVQNHRAHGRPLWTGLGAAGMAGIVAAQAPFGVEIVPHAIHTPALMGSSAALLTAQLWGRRLANQTARGACCHGEK